MKNNRIKRTGCFFAKNVDVFLEPHELATINTLLAEGYNVELIRRSRTPRAKSADIFMLKLVWEMKSPNGKDIRAIERCLRRATHQSQNIIIDLRRTRVPDCKAIAVLEKLFVKLRSIRNLWIITKDQDIKKYRK